ncbi:MAG: hypothetical protein V1660_03635 [archaeon]
MAKKKQRTIGDQLKEEGMIQEPQRTDDEVTVEKKTELSELIVKIDRLEGKLEMLKEVSDAINSRISDINERMGDLRRMVLDSEQVVGELKASFEKVKDIVKELEPQKLVRDLQKFEGEMTNGNAKIEKAGIAVENFNQRIKRIEEEFNKIKSFDNMVDVLKRITEKEKGIEEARRYADRVGAKVDSIFSDINEKVAELTQERLTIVNLDELSNKMVKDLADLQFKFNEKTLKKDDLEMVKETIAKDIVGINPLSFESLRKKVSLIEFQAKTTDELEEEKKRLQHLLDTAKADFDAKKLSPKSYEELRNACQIKIAEVEITLAKKKAPKDKNAKELKEEITKAIKEEITQGKINEKKEEEKKEKEQEKNKKHVKEKKAIIHKLREAVHSSKGRRIKKKEIKISAKRETTTNKELESLLLTEAVAKDELFSKLKEVYAPAKEKKKSPQKTKKRKEENITPLVKIPIQEGNNERNKVEEHVEETLLEEETTSEEEQPIQENKQKAEKEEKEEKEENDNSGSLEEKEKIVEELMREAEDDSKKLENALHEMEKRDSEVTASSEKRDNFFARFRKVLGKKNK